MSRITQGIRQYAGNITIGAWHSSYRTTVAHANDAAGNGGEKPAKLAPELSQNMAYIHTGTSRPIRVYKSVDSRFILEDLYARLALFVFRAAT